MFQAGLLLSSGFPRQHAIIGRGHWTRLHEPLQAPRCFGAKMLTHFAFHTMQALFFSTFSSGLMAAGESPAIPRSDDPTGPQKWRHQPVEPVEPGLCSRITWVFGSFGMFQVQGRAILCMGPTTVSLRPFASSSKLGKLQPAQSAKRLQRGIFDIYM